MLSRGCDLENDESKYQGNEIREDNEQCEPEKNGDELGLEDDLCSDILKAKGAFHLNGTFGE